MLKLVEKIIEDRSKLDEHSKLKLIRAVLMYTTPYLSLEEAETFLTTQENLSNPDALLTYVNIEKRIADAYSSVYDESSEKWEREKFIKEMRDILKGLHSPSELNELESLLIGPRDVSAFIMNIAGDHYGMRRIRNAYLPEITDLIQIDAETGVGRDLTKELFKEGSGDAVSRIETILGLRKNKE